VIADQIKHDSETVMTFDGFAPQAIDDRAFNPNRSGG